MSTIDKQRIATVRKLEQLGYTFAAGDCAPNQRCGFSSSYH